MRLLGLVPPLLALSAAASAGTAPSLYVDPNSRGSCRTSQYGTDFVDQLGAAVVGGDGEEKTVSFAVQQTLGFGPFVGYLGMQEFDCFVTGAGAARYGSLAARVDSSAGATPETLEPAPGSGNEPQSLDGYARAESLLRVGFDDVGVVTGAALGAGAPVTLDFTFTLDALALVSGRPLGANGAANAAFTIDVVDLSAFDPVTGYPTLHRVVYGPDPVLASFATAVGHELALTGLLELATVAHAGRDPNGIGPFYSDVEANIDAEHTAVVTLAGPEGTGFDAESGHSYVAAPEPAQQLLLLAGTLVLLGRGSSRAARPAAMVPGART